MLRVGASRLAAARPALGALAGARRGLAAGAEGLPLEPPVKMYGIAGRYANALYSAAAQNWDVKKFHAHKIGCNAASWAPAVAAGTTGGDAAAERRLVTGGCDNLVKIWRCTDEGEWEKEKELAGHSDWVRDVAWAPSLGASESMIASCSQDKKVIIWTRDAAAAGEWARKELLFSSAVWRVSWSVTGNILAVSSGDNQVTLWKETLVGEWEQVGQLSEDGSVVKG